MGRLDGVLAGEGVEYATLKGIGVMLTLRPRLRAVYAEGLPCNAATERRSSLVPPSQGPKLLTGRFAVIEHQIAPDPLSQSLSSRKEESRWALVIALLV